MSHFILLRIVSFCTLTLVTLGLLSACGGGGNDNDDDDLAYKAQVRRTSFGIPHIKADDYGSMGYAYGYVHAEDTLCTLAEDFLTIRGERSRFMGRDGSYTIVPNGTTANNVDSDFFWKAVATDAAIAPLKNSDKEALQATRGFVAGYNRYVRELKSGKHSGRHQACRNEAWLAGISENDMFRRYFRLVILASSSVFIEGIATAAPPGLDNLPLPVSLDDILALDPGSLPLVGELPFASNMYALGPEATSDGRSMLLGNPHFPWSGTERLYLSHLILPDAEIMGASLYGVPAALIGFNEHFAWSHTVSTAFRFSFYELTLNPLDPTQYFYDGELRDMQASEISIQVLEEDGSSSTETRTLYRSHLGPMLEFAVSGVPILEWSPLKAYTLRDANAENDRLMNQFFRWNRAKSFEEFVELHSSVLGIPWVNTAATGPGKPAYYGDITVVPNVPDSKVQSCGAIPLQTVLSQLMPGLPILDGSRSQCEWDTDPDAPAPGIFGPANLPKLTRDDWVHNCNDSYWLTNPDEPLTGFAGIIGDEGTARSLRTRLCMQHVIRRLDSSDGRPGNTFDLPTLQEVTLDSAVLSAELGKDAVLGSYCLLPFALGSSGPVDISAACQVLADWDGSNNLISVGGHIWREFWRRIGGPLPVATPLNDLIWLTSFSAADGVNTPRDLNVLNPAVEIAFADGVQAVLDSPFEVDTPMGEIQHSGIHEDFIPIFGGEGFEGSFTIANARSSGLGDNGYEITYGNSYIQTVTWNANNKPIAEGFVTYSQSTDPASPYYQDMTEAYSAKQWIRFPWTEAEIAADTKVTLQLEE